MDSVIYGVVVVVVVVACILSNGLRMQPVRATCFDFSIDWLEGATHDEMENSDDCVRARACAHI